MKRTVKVRVSEFSLEALGAEGDGREQLELSLVRAVRLYLSDRESEQPGWEYPAALSGQRLSGGVELELEVGEELWDAFEQEAARQQVSVSRLAAHAILYHAAELDAGRITQRLVDGFDGEGELKPSEG